MPSEAHNRLTALGARWMRRNGFPVVATELKCIGSREQPFGSSSALLRQRQYRKVQVPEGEGAKQLLDARRVRLSAPGINPAPFKAVWCRWLPDTAPLLS